MFQEARHLETGIARLPPLLYLISVTLLHRGSVSGPAQGRFNRAATLKRTLPSETSISLMCLAWLQNAGLLCSTVT